MSFELCVEPARECQRPQHTRVIIKDSWYHLQKVLSWISSGLLIERARSGQDKGCRSLKPFISAVPTMSVNLEPSSQLAFQSQYLSSLLASSSRMAFARAHVVATIPEPFTQLVKQHLRVINPHGQPVAFKVKTTAPKVGYSNLVQLRPPSFTRICPTAILRSSKLGQDRTRRGHRSTR